MKKRFANLYKPIGPRAALFLFLLLCWLIFISLLLLAGCVR